MRPSFLNGQLVFNFVGHNKTTTTRTIYGVYHGRFIDAMLTHCDDLFSAALASAMPTNSDYIQHAA
jgi:hypothetical protein